MQINSSKEWSKIIIIPDIMVGMDAYKKKVTKPSGKP